MYLACTQDCPLLLLLCSIKSNGAQTEPHDKNTLSRCWRCLVAARRWMGSRAILSLESPGKAQRVAFLHDALAGMGATFFCLCS